MDQQLAASKSSHSTIHIRNLAPQMGAIRQASSNKRTKTKFRKEMVFDFRFSFAFTHTPSLVPLCVDELGFAVGSEADLAHSERFIRFRQRQGESPLGHSGV